MIHTGVRYLPTTNTSWPDFERFPSPICRKCFDLGFRSTRSIAFGGGNGLRGVLDLGRRTDEPFTHDEVDLLVQVHASAPSHSKTQSLIANSPSSKKTPPRKSCTGRHPRLKRGAPQAETRGGPVRPRNFPPDSRRSSTSSVNPAEFGSLISVCRYRQTSSAPPQPNPLISNPCNTASQLHFRSAIGSARCSG